MARGWHVRSFLAGAGPAVIGAIAGSAIPVGLAFQQWWQVPVLAGALLLAGGVGVLLALSGIVVESFGDPGRPLNT